MWFGVSTYSLTWALGVPGYPRAHKPLDALGFLERVGRAGVDLVQISDNVPLVSLSKSELSEVRRSAVEKSIRVELGTRGTDPDHLRQYLLLADFFEAKVVRTMVTCPDLKDALRDLKPLLPELAARKVRLAIENHGLHKCGALADLIRNLDSPWVGACLDTVNNFGALELPDTVTQTLLPLAFNIHLKDFTIQRHRHMMGFEILGTPAGKGLLDIDRLVRDAETGGQNPTTILEVWVPFTGDVEETVAREDAWLDESLAFLKGVQI